MKNNSQKGFVVPLVIVIVALIAAGVIYSVTKKSGSILDVNVNATTTVITATSTIKENAASEPVVIKALIENWKTIAPAIIPGYPSSNVAFYGYPMSIVFIGNNKVIISYQDNYNVHQAVLSYDTNFNFSYITGQIDELNAPSKVTEWMKQYSSPSATLNRYNFSSTRTGSTVYPSDWVLEGSNSTTKTYSGNGYSFVYPAKLTLTATPTATAVTLSHTIPFENRNGGCDMSDEGPVSKTLQDFGLTLEIKAGIIKPADVDATTTIGTMTGTRSYMGAEGCGETKYYFPISGNRTLIVTKKEIQILSDVVDPSVRARVLAVPGVISAEEGRMIVEQILTSFKITN